MESILTDVCTVLENWLSEISTKEKQLNRIISLQERLAKKSLQFQIEGSDGGIDIERLRFVSQCWSGILGLITCLPDTKNELIYKVLQLLDSAEISVIFAYEIITKVS